MLDSEDPRGDPVPGFRTPMLASGVEAENPSLGVERLRAHWFYHPWWIPGGWGSAGPKPCPGRGVLTLVQGVPPGMR